MISQSDSGPGKYKISHSNEYGDFISYADRHNAASIWAQYLSGEINNEDYCKLIMWYCIDGVNVCTCTCQ